MVWPVMKSLAGEERKTTVPAKSVGSPLRPTMVRLASAAARTGSDATLSVSGVATKPGQIALTVTPDGAHASDRRRVRAASGALEGADPPLLPDARWACAEGMLVGRPRP